MTKEAERIFPSFLLNKTTYFWHYRQIVEKARQKTAGINSTDKKFCSNFEISIEKCTEINYYVNQCKFNRTFSLKIKVMMQK